MYSASVLTLCTLALAVAYFLAGVVDPCSWAPINLMTQDDIEYCIESQNLLRLRSGTYPNVAE